MRATTGVTWLGALGILTVSSETRADPQWHVGWHTEWCLTGTAGAFLEESSWCNQLALDLILLRERNADFGLGPYLAAGSADFADVRVEGGLSAVIPVHPTYPLVTSLGLVGHGEDGAWEPGVSAWLLWGPRNYNFHGSYSAAGGLVVGVHRGFGEPQATTLHVGLALDGMWLALPFIAGYQWLRGSPD